MIIIEDFSFQWIHWKIHIGKKLDCLKQICLNDSNQTTELSTYKAPETAYLCQFTLISCCFYEYILCKGVANWLNGIDTHFHFRT